MSGETVRMAWGAAWLVSGRSARARPIQVAARRWRILPAGLVTDIGWTAAHSGLREGPGAGLGRFCLKRVAWVPGPIKPQSSRGGVPSVVR